MVVYRTKKEYEKARIARLQQALKASGVRDVTPGEIMAGRRTTAFERRWWRDIGYPQMIAERRRAAGLQVEKYFSPFEKEWTSYEQKVMGWPTPKTTLARRQLRLPRIQRVRMTRFARAEVGRKAVELTRISQARRSLATQKAQELAKIK